MTRSSLISCDRMWCEDLPTTVPAGPAEVVTRRRPPTPPRAVIARRPAGAQHAEGDKSPVARVVRTSEPPRGQLPSFVSSDDTNCTGSTHTGVRSGNMAFESDPRPMAHGRRRSVAARARHDDHGGLR